MADFQTLKQSESFSTPEPPKRASMPQLGHYQLGESLFSPSPNTQEDNQVHGDLKSLVDSSEPDLQPSLTYLGPPIGFSAKLVQHCTPRGVATTTVYGSLMAPRPRLFMQCNDHLCLTCRPVLSLDYPSAGTGTGSTTPTPQSSRPREYVSPRSSPKLDMQKILRELQMGLD